MAHVFHIELDEGADYSRTFVFEDGETGLPVDLTDYEARMQIRQGYNGQSKRDAVLSLSSATADHGYGILLGGQDGTVQIVLKGQHTRFLNCNEAVYDLFLIAPSGKRTKFLEGFVTLIPSATKGYPGDPNDLTEFTLAQHSTPIRIYNTTQEETLATIMIPANSVEPNGMLKISTFFQVTNSDSQKILRVRLGNTIINEIKVRAVNGTEFDTYVFATDSGEEQNVWFGTATNYRGIGNWETWHFDMTQDQVLTITGQMSVLEETISLNAYTVKVNNP